MDLENSAFWIWWKRYGEHIMAPCILILLIMIWYLYFHSNQLQEEISLTCGWETEDYRCFCQESVVVDMEWQHNTPNISMGDIIIPTNLSEGE